MIKPFLVMGRNAFKLVKEEEVPVVASTTVTVDNDKAIKDLIATIQSLSTEELRAVNDFISKGLKSI